METDKAMATENILKSSQELGGRETIYKVSDLLKKTDEKAVVKFTDIAMTKITTLLLACDSTEVGWHGIGMRKGPGEYLIEDIFLYNQTTGSAAVRVGDAQYDKWLYNFTINNEDKLEKLCFHGHSHVDMDVFASGTDKDFQDDTIEMIQPGRFYIFMIVNRKLNCYFKIVDRVDGEKIYESPNVWINTESGSMKEIAEQYRDVEKPAPMLSKFKYGYGGRYGY